MLGAIIGDIAGSRFERRNHRDKRFELFDRSCRPTDDSIMTLAIAKAILKANRDKTDLGKKAVKYMRELGRRYPDSGYGQSFLAWIQSKDPHPFGSFGNGAAMRVSPCAYAATSLEEAIAYSNAVTAVTHDHPEGLRGAAATTAAVYMALHGHELAEIERYINEAFYRIDFTIDSLRPHYTFDVSCQGSVPVALEAFFESVSFEDAIRNAVSVGGDSDTIAAIAGSVVGAYYGIPEAIRTAALRYLDTFQLKILNAFERTYGIVPDRQA